MANETKLTKGETITISTGEYSDYYVRGVFRVTADFEPQEMIDAYLAEHPDQREPYSAEITEFLVWLATKNILEPVESREWHLSSYGTFCCDLT
jgi:hypothetical protein